MKPRILLADDHAIIREGLRALIEKQLGYEVVGEADNGKTAIHLAEELQPDLLIMDVNMPGTNGIEAAREILKHTPGVKIITLSMHADRRYVMEMLGMGASAYVLKESAFREVEQAIRAALSNHRYVSPGIGADVIAECLERLSATPSVSGELTAKEREVLQLIAEGKINKEIADYLDVSVKTIDNHRQRIMAKLNLHTVADLTKYAIREGLTSLEK
jgi:DNA-binding NarL/FixJ family response regulator